MTHPRCLVLLSLFATVALAACGAPETSAPTARSLAGEAQALSVTVEGRLCNLHTGTLVVGATIDVRDEAGVLTTSLTDDSGAYAIDGLASGLLVVTAMAPGFQKSFVFETSPGDVVIASDAEGCE